MTDGKTSEPSSPGPWNAAGWNPTGSVGVQPGQSGSPTTPPRESAWASSASSAQETSGSDAAGASGFAGVTAGIKEQTRKLGSALNELQKPNPAAAAAAAHSAPSTRRTRKARLRISRVDPWSVMKTALMFGIAAWIIFVVATYAVMSVIESTGLFTAINDTVQRVFESPTSTTKFTIETYVNTRRVTGLATLIGAVDVVIVTALATVFAFLYNLSATMLGGLEITLAED